VILLLLKIKHRLPILWRVIEQVNSLLFMILHNRRVMANAHASLDRYRLAGFHFRPITSADSAIVSAFLSRQSAARMEFFKPHGFDLQSVTRKTKEPAFLMFGTFKGEAMVGYFFLRCFWNRKAFVGRAIDRDWAGQGIGCVMNQILYYTAWESRFRCLTTISKHNHSVIRSHANNPCSRIIGDLANDYMLVEMVSPGQQSAGTPVCDRVGVE